MTVDLLGVPQDDKAVEEVEECDVEYLTDEQSDMAEDEQMSDGGPLSDDEMDTTEEDATPGAQLLAEASAATKAATAVLQAQAQEHFLQQQKTDLHRHRALIGKQENLFDECLEALEGWSYLLRRCV